MSRGLNLWTPSGKQRNIIRYKLQRGKKKKKKLNFTHVRSFSWDRGKRQTRRWFQWGWHIRWRWEGFPTRAVYQIPALQIQRWRARQRTGTRTKGKWRERDERWFWDKRAAHATGTDFWKASFTQGWRWIVLEQSWWWGGGTREEGVIGWITCWIRKGT